jgi:hypothetical protein
VFFEIFRTYNEFAELRIPIKLKEFCRKRCLFTISKPIFLEVVTQFLEIKASLHTAISLAA